MLEQLPAQNPVLKRTESYWTPPTMIRNNYVSNTIVKVSNVEQYLYRSLEKFDENKECIQECVRNIKTGKVVEDYIYDKKTDKIIRSSSPDRQVLSRDLCGNA